MHVSALILRSNNPNFLRNSPKWDQHHQKTMFTTSIGVHFAFSVIQSELKTKPLRKTNRRSLVWFVPLRRFRTYISLKTQLTGYWTSNHFLLNFQSKEPISIPNWSSLLLCSKRSERQKPLDRYIKRFELWAVLDSNQRPLRCQRNALTN